MKHIGFIGIGVMGKEMARNLMKAGYEVSVYTRTREKAEDIISEGARWCESIEACVKGQEAVITMVGYPKDVREVYFAAEGILAHAEPGTYLIDMTTTSPRLSEEIFEAAQARGLHAVDAPVSGGDLGAKNGTLSIMAGGREEDFQACMELFQSMGKTCIYEGKAGSGQHTKMANQIALCGIISSLCEALSYAEKAGLDQETMLKSISQGAAGSWQMTNMAPKIIKGNMEPGFYIKHFIKDMGIALEEAELRKLQLPVLEQVMSMYQELEKSGLGEKGTQALIEYYE